MSFGKRKLQSAVVTTFRSATEEDIKLKLVEEVLDDSPVVTQKQLEFIHWIADYYLCTPGEALNAALPASLKISSESRLAFYEEFSDWDLVPKELEEVLAFIKEEQPIKIEELEAQFPGLKPSTVLKKLISLRAIVLFEQWKEKSYSPRYHQIVCFSHKYQVDEILQEELPQLLGRSPKQLEVIQILLEKGQVKGVDWAIKVEKSTFTKLGLTAAVNELVKKQILDIEEVLPLESSGVFNLPTLSEAQKTAKQAILTGFANAKPVLLHGITGSGKTEVYIQLINEMLDAGRQILFMLPEIALTSQIVKRLQLVFGQSLVVYHSKISEKERHLAYLKVKSGDAPIVLGVRSSIFLPFNDLGLIIIDEEHDPSYKQSDVAPRYLAREAAIVLAKLHQGNTLLGSATPSIESYYQASENRWVLVNLHERFAAAVLPEITLVNLQQERALLRMNGSFSQTLLDELDIHIEQQQQVILFQNRRGFAPYQHCESCGHIPKCIRCDVSLTLHQAAKKLRCHYCGYEEAKTLTCVNCGSPSLHNVGYGTERIEEELQSLRPHWSLDRLDLDTAKSKKRLKQVLDSVTNQETQVLIGTQMVSKGFDFPGVKLVGVFDVDKMLHLPDFRASERTFHTVTQVAGRAGRTGSQGKVLIQTGNPEQQVLQWITNGDYLSFYQYEIREREKFHYPPFSRLILIVFRHEKQSVALQAAEAVTSPLRTLLGAARILGPESPPVSKIRDQYIIHSLLKIDPSQISMKALKQEIVAQIALARKTKEFQSVHIHVNVDP